MAFIWSLLGVTSCLICWTFVVSFVGSSVRAWERSWFNRKVSPAGMLVGSPELTTNLSWRGTWGCCRLDWCTVASRCRRRPRADTDHLKDFFRWEIPEDQRANLLLLRGQLDRPAFDEETPGLKDVDPGEKHAPSERGPQRRRLQKKVGHRGQRGRHSQQAQPQNVRDAVGQEQQDIGRG